MPQPQGSDLRVDRLLTDFIIGTKNESYIADQLAPPLMVMKPTGYIPQLDQSSWFRNQAAIRAPGTVSVSAGYNTTNSNTYSVKRYSLAVPVADEVRDAAEVPYMPDREAAALAVEGVRLSREVACAAAVLGASAWTTTVTGGTTVTQWSNYAASDPLSDITTYQDTVLGLVAREPRTLAMGNQVWIQLKWHPDAIDSVKYTQKGVISPELFASLLGLDSILVGKGIYTTTKEGTAESSVTYSRIWGKSALLVYAGKSGEMITPAAVRTVVWNRPGIPNALEYVVRHRNDEAETDKIEANTYYQHLVLSAGAGVEFTSIVA
jgi:hypothetical protein